MSPVICTYCGYEFAEDEEPAGEWRGKRYCADCAVHCNLCDRLISVGDAYVRDDTGEVYCDRHRGVE